jgi:hypothetical protein
MRAGDNPTAAGRNSDSVIGHEAGEKANTPSLFDQGEAQSRLSGSGSTPDQHACVADEDDGRVHKR